MTNEQTRFVNKFSTEIRARNAAVFAGAGLSVPSGSVGWGELLEPFAEELGLNPKNETDFVRIAQYYVNHQQGHRGGIDKLITDKFGIALEPNENHKLLASLPIETYWTTNYDRLIETSLEREGKIADVKHTTKQLTQTLPHRDVTLYKMHGDVSRPDEAVLTRDDYEKYHKTRKEFVRGLGGDLVNRTFLFIGFSFSDPNFDYILSRVRSEYGPDTRPHYFIVRAPQESAFDTHEEYRYKMLCHELHTKDLRRLGMTPVSIDSYSEVTSLLQELNRKWRQDTVFLSGAAHQYGCWTEGEGNEFIQKLSAAMVENKYKIVSGYGLGVGSAVIAGAVGYIYGSNKPMLRDHLMLRPFPVGTDVTAEERTAYRKDMIRHAGASVFLFGNKIVSGNVMPSNGMEEEFNIAKELSHFLIPVGATGTMSQKLWNRIEDNFDEYFPNQSAEARELFHKLGDTSCSSSDLIEVTIKLMKTLLRS